MIYFYIFFLLIFLCYNFDFSNKGGKDSAYWTTCLILILLAGFRYRVGGDTLNYMYTHELIPQFTIYNILPRINGVRAEQGWIMLTSLAKLIGPDFYWVQLIQAAIVNIAFFTFFKRYTKYCFSCVLFYYICAYFYFNFEILRESLAVSIFLLFSIRYLAEKKYLKYFLSIIVTMAFHSSAILLVIIPTLYNLVNRKEANFLVICTIIYVFGLFLNPLFNQLIIGLGLFSDKFGTYLDYNFTIFGKIMGYILYVLLPLIVYHYAKKYESPSRYFLVIYALIGASTSLFSIFFRFINYFTPFLILNIALIFVEVLLNSKTRTRIENSIIYILFIVVFFNQRIFVTVDKNNNYKWYSYWYPYHSIFDPQIDPTREYIWRNN